MNFLNALRATLAVVISFFVLSALAKEYHQPSTLPFLGVMLAMNASMFVRDPSQRQQKVTMLLVAIPACLAVAAALYLEPWPDLRVAGLMAVIYFAVLIRRWGTRWLGMGMVAFMAYFLPLFFPIHTESLPAASVCVLIAVSIAYVIRFWLLPDRPEKTLRLYLEGFDAQKRDALYKLLEVLQQKGTWEKFEAAFEKLNELSLTIEEFLASTHSRKLKSSAERLQMLLFDQELAIRQIADEACLLKLEDLLGHLPEFSQRIEKIAKDTEPTTPSDREVEQIVDEIQEVSAPELPVKGLHLTTKQAIQATLATALASVAGKLISPQRWYWAALASFVIFIGSSRGDTMMRALYRIVGTAAGLIVGFGLSHAAKGNPTLEWSLIVACIFLGVFGSRIAFGFWTASLFTVMVAILFDVLGTLTNGVLILRLEETFVGAVIGAVVGALVLPTSARLTVRLALAKLLRTISRVLETLPLGDQSHGTRRVLVHSMRAVDRDLMALRVASASVINGLTLMKRGDIPAAVHDASMLSHYILHLSTRADSSGLSFEQLRERCRLLADCAQRLAKALETGGDKHEFNASCSQVTLLDQVAHSLASLARRKL